jgi:hypothetical protein
MNATKWIPSEDVVPVKKSPAIYETRSITIFTEDCHCTYHEPDKSSPLPKKILLWDTF